MKEVLVELGEGKVSVFGRVLGAGNADVGLLTLEPAEMFDEEEGRVYLTFKTVESVRAVRDILNKLADMIEEEEAE